MEWKRNEEPQGRAFIVKGGRVKELHKGQLGTESGRNRIRAVQSGLGLLNFPGHRMFRTIPCQTKTVSRPTIMLIYLCSRPGATHGESRKTTALNFLSQILSMV